ncbi:glycerate kinase [Streptomyces sp. DSM 44917]|uniref:Glycerate kinase n=1 Tax=Streptomyces boetiae TaxID=3075541 RepID=A0ABU2L5I9_9ACTN|nr:glycerate kinase [Streptomyces sp. DSM 44917]MDT0306819.1 glycerate kinase [Streptomyces sp. DSM 44917]
MSPLSRFAVAPSGLKESLTAPQAAQAIAAGLHRVAPRAEIDLIPLVDGGEGTAAALAAASGGRLIAHTATGPLGEAVPGHYALLGDGTAVVEMAAVAGLSLIPPRLRDPGRTTTFGVGELIRAALDAGARRVLVGCGDSGTSDGGAGALQALGARLLDASGRELPRGGGALVHLFRIDPTGLDPRLRATELLVACNPHNVLCGPMGVARVFGPQKGAGPAQVEHLSAALERWAAILHRDLRPAAPNLRTAPGTGASGGLGAGLAALGARLLPRFDVLLGHLDLDARLARADLVITAEGALDHQSPRGKIPGEIARRARALGVPALVLAGILGEGADDIRSAGAAAYCSILPAPLPLPEALARAAEFLTAATERALRLVALGHDLALTGPRPPWPHLAHSASDSGA